MAEKNLDYAWQCTRTKTKCCKSGKTTAAPALLYF